MIWSNLAKFLLGVILAIAILMAGGVVVALYFVTRVSIAPPKPVFVNDKPAVKAQASRSPTTAKRTEQPNTPVPSQKPSAKPLEPGAYRARITWSEGLSLRSEPNQDAERIGGVGYNQQIVVLAESADKNWQRVRLSGSEQEGWIKAGNIERVNEQ